MRTLVAAVSVFAMLLIFPPEGVAQSTLDGEWVVTINSPLGPFEFPVTIVQEGDELTVSTTPSPEGELAFMGRVDGSSVRFEFDTDYEGAALPITLTGRITSGRMEGPANFGGLAVGDWNAVRSRDTTR